LIISPLHTAARGVEIVERKGLGHLDTICDARSVSLTIGLPSLRPTAWRDVYPDAGYTPFRATAAYFDKIWPLTDIERVKLTREKTSPVGTTETSGGRSWGSADRG
jgi:hypothetical protein